jgi:hypothetical protein
MQANSLADNRFAEIAHACSLRSCRFAVVRIRRFKASVSRNFWLLQAALALGLIDCMLAHARRFQGVSYDFMILSCRCVAKAGCGDDMAGFVLIE